MIEAREVFTALAADLLPHMEREERVLFPYVAELERAAQSGASPRTPFFGAVANPVRMMMLEHDAAGGMLRRLRELTNGYAVPQNVCITFATLYGALADLERDLHEHIHLENNVLFPRALAIEAA